MTGKRSYHHGNLRQALIDAGVEALSEGQELSLRQLSRKLGVSHNAPYMHFKDKESLVAAIAEDGFLMLRRDIAAAMHGDGDWRTRFEQGGRAYIQFVRRYPAHVNVMFRTYDDRFDSLRDASTSAMRVLVDMIAEGQQLGVIRAGSPADLAGFTWSLLHGISGILVTSGGVPHVMGEKSEQDLIDDYIDIALSGLTH